MKYFRYIVRHNDETTLHFIAKAISDTKYEMHIKVIILRVFVDKTNYNNFEEGETCYINNPIDGFLHEKCYRKVTNKVGKMYEKRLKSLKSLCKNSAITCAYNTAFCW